MRRALLVAFLTLSLTSIPAAVRADDAPPPSPPPAGNRALTVDEAVKLAIDSNPQIASGRLQRDALLDQSNSIRGHMLPAVILNEELQVYTTPWTLDFPLPEMAPLAIQARNQVTNTFVAGLGQPVTGLLGLMESRAALESTAQSADSQIESGNAAIREAIQAGYLRYFEAKATEDIAKTSEAQLREQEQLTDVKMKAGVLTKADLLRLQVAEANANQQEIQAQAQEHITRAQLLTAMGFSPDDVGVTFVEPTALEQAPAPTLGESEAQQQAFHKRPEAVAKVYDLESAKHATRAKLYDFLPTVNLEAAYLNIQGQIFAQENSAYIGVKANWNIWEWGASWYALRAAEEQAEAARNAQEDIDRQVRVDASTKLFEVRAAQAAVSSAQAAIASAEESYRVNAELVRVGSATTTTELLDAQTALTTAKLNLVRATYEQAIAAVALHRAIGD
jgi:outer membrane protein